MTGGFIGVVTVDLHLAAASSLKEKRKQLLRLKAALVKGVGASVAEVGDHELHRRARLTAAFVTREAGEAENLIDRARRTLYDDPEFEVLDMSTQLLSADELPSLAIGG